MKRSGINYFANGGSRCGAASTLRCWCRWPAVFGLITEAALLTIPAAVFMLIGGAMLACLLRFICRPREMWRAWGAGAALFFGRSSAPSRRWEAGFFSLVYCPITQLPSGYIGALIAALVLCVFIAWKTPRYTQRGLDELAIAKGLMRYLGTAEKHRYQINLSARADDFPF
ncbi:Uncharacterised protein [Klebsiella michiganensis]|nr:Uncharacterised protein [Klebsiella michiganensis]